MFNESHCPYCHGVKSLMPGHIYRLLQATPIADMSKGTSGRTPRLSNTASFTRLLFVHPATSNDIDRISSVKRSTREELFRRLALATDFMEANLGHKTTLEHIATAACLSVHHFKREFKLLYGVTPHRHLFLKRIERAMYLLRGSSQTIAEVAEASGFENTSSFIRQFRRFSGFTPGQFRKALR